MTDQTSKVSGNVSVPRATVQRVLDDAAYISQVDRQALHAILAKPAAPIEQPHEIPVAGLHCWSCKADFTLEDRAKCDGCCWKCGSELELDSYVTRLQAEAERLKALLGQASGMVNGASNEWHDQVAKELRP